MNAVARTLGIRAIDLPRVEPAVGSWVLAVSGAAIQTGIITRITGTDADVIVTVRSGNTVHQHIGDIEFFEVSPIRTTEPVSLALRVAGFFRGRDARLRAPAIRGVLDIDEGHRASTGDIGLLSVVLTDETFAQITTVTEVSPCAFRHLLSRRWMAQVSHAVYPVPLGLA